jgi:two-component system nitrate/nitrite response regulator NarL
VDLCALLREGLLRVLGETQFRVMLFVNCADELPRFAWGERKKILFIVGAGDDPDVLVRQVERFKELYPYARIVALGDLYPPTVLLSVLRAGVDAFLPKFVSSDALVKTMELVMLGETILPSGVASAISSHVVERKEAPSLVQLQTADTAQDPFVHRLSEREVDTLYCLLHGDSNKIIARKFTIAEATVKVHVKAILRKIRVHNRTQAAIWAMNNLPPRSEALVRIVGANGAGVGPSSPLNQHGEQRIAT